MRENQIKKISFRRPPYAEEVFTDDGKKRFNNLPGWQRHFVKQIIKHADVKKAANEAGVSRHANDNIDWKRAEEKGVAESLNEGGLDTQTLVTHLADCLDASVIKTDKHGNPFDCVDKQLKLKTLELIFKLRGDFDTARAKESKDKSITELFKDTDVTEETKTNSKES